MGVVKNLIVRAGADFSAITKQANKAKASMQGMQTSVSRSCTLMTKSATTLNKVLGTLGVGLSVAAIVAAAKGAKDAYDEQTEASAKLAQVMRNTMGARSEEIKSIEDLIDAQERLGVVKGGVQTEAAQELGTYLTLSSSLKTLIPVMNDMVAQQYGMKASAESAVSIATMMGKVMHGQTSALSRYGYSFTAAQEAILKYGTEEQRAATLAEAVEESVGGMNAALAATPNGRLQQVSNTLGKIQETFGQAVSNIAVLFIPAMNAVCNVLASAATLANKVAQTLANVFGGGKSAAAAAVTYTGAVSGALEDVEGSAASAGKAMQALMGFDQITKLSDSSSGTAGTAAGSDSGGSISESFSEADEAGESIGWLEERLTALKEKFAGIDTSKLTDSLARLKAAVEPFKEKLFSGLSWAMDNIFVPLGTWAMESALPAFLDVLSNGVSLLTSVLGAFQPMGSWLWENFLQPLASWTGDLVVSTLQEISDLLSDLSDLVSGNTTLGDFIADLSPAQTALLGIAGALGTIAVVSKTLTGLNAITTFITSVKNLNVAGIFGKLVDVIALTSSGAWTLSEAMKDVFGPSSVLAGVGALVGGAILAVTNFFSMLKNGFSWVKEALMVVGTAIAAVGAVILGAPALVAGVVAAVVAAVATAVVLVKEHWEDIKATFSAVCESIKTAWNNGMTSLKQWGSDAWASIKGVWSAAGSWFDGVAVTVQNAWRSGMSSVKQWGSDAWTSIKGTWSEASGWFTDHVTTPIQNGFKTFANGIISFFEGIVNSGISGINKLIGAINKLSFKAPDWVPVIGGKSWGFNLKEVSKVSLPRIAMATGGIVTRPTPALIGEDGPEAVIPLSENAAWLDALAARIAALIGAVKPGGPMKLTIPVYVGGRKVTEVVIDDINEIINTTGVCPIKI